MLVRRFIFCQKNYTKNKFKTGILVTLIALIHIAVNFNAKKQTKV
jgi:hypothetical protein